MPERRDGGLKFKSIALSAVQRVALRKAAAMTLARSPVRQQNNMHAP